LTVAISATFTAEALEPGLAFWMRELELAGKIQFAAYNQVFQELLDPNGLFARNGTGANVVLVRFEDWNAGQAGEFVEALRAAAGRLTAPLIVVLCEGTREYDVLLRRFVCDLPSVHLVTSGEIDALYPVAEVHDPHANQLGHVPYTPAYFVALATTIARKIHAITAAPFKVIALDCDDTLWSGICGEDGPEGVTVDAPRRELQEFMRSRREEGMLLALCSKNNEEDVAATFRAHPEMPLRMEDFAAQRVNWEPKGANLVSLAEELDLGLDSVILVDDNPKEVTEAQAGAPEALSLVLPGRAAEIPEFLRHVWAFDRARVTEEDRRRPEMYAQRAVRTRAQRGAASLEEFLASLKLEVGIAAMEAGQAVRVAQLTQRTNQMNATCIRRTAAEIQRLAAQCLTVRVADRFGSYGLTGVMIFREQAAALTVDTFLLSCRALGRGVEHRMVARLGEMALERGLERVEIPFVEGQRNRPALLFLRSLATQDRDGVFRLAAASAAEVKYRPGAGEMAELPASEGRPAGVATRIPYARIATELRDPERILAQIRSGSRRATTARRADPPRTALERDLVVLWAELLNIEAAGIHDNFFEVGGHSLLAVQLLSRVRQIYGVELSLEVVYSGEFTVAELAKAIELKEIEQSGGDYQELLQELDGLSDEEVRALLAEEQDAS
jgi:FkbH-like protein